MVGKDYCVFFGGVVEGDSNEMGVFNGVVIEYEGVDIWR